VPRVRDPTEAEVLELLRDPECPRGRAVGADEALVPVMEFIAFARSRGYATGSVEALADACVERRGGERRRVVDPWSWLPNLVRR
jgi:hypothetical protein